MHVRVSPSQRNWFLIWLRHTVASELRRVYYVKYVQIFIINLLFILTRNITKKVIPTRYRIFKEII